MSYLLASILWGFVGFITGLLTSHIIHERPRISTGAFLMLLAAAFISTGIYEQAQRQDDIECQVRTNEAFRDALIERGAAAEEDRDALKELVNQIGANMRTDNEAGLHAALQDYRATVEANEDEREEAPLPETNCG